VKSRLIPATLLYAALVFVALIVIGARDGRLDLAAAEPGIATAALVGLGAGCVLVLLTIPLRRYRPFRRIEAMVRLVLPSLGRGEIVVLAVASAIGEELFFRAALQPWVGLVPASLLFGACHFSRRVPIWSIWAAVGGVIFGSLFDATGGVFAPVVAHATVNAIGLARIRARSTRRRGNPPTPGDGAAIDR